VPPAAVRCNFILYVRVQQTDALPSHKMSRYPSLIQQIILQSGWFWISVKSKVSCQHVHKNQHKNTSHAQHCILPYTIMDFPSPGPCFFLSSALDWSLTIINLQHEYLYTFRAKYSHINLNRSTSFLLANNIRN